MKQPDEATGELLRLDLDQREECIRQRVYEAMDELPPADLAEHLVATYFVAARSTTPAVVGREIAYHMTSGVRTAPSGSLLAACSGHVVDSIAWDAGQRMGIVRVAFPLKMLLTEQDEIFSTDVLHIAAGAGIFALTENVDIKLVHLAMSPAVLRRFPGPAYGAPGIRKLVRLADDEIAFGTILKPCTGITPEEEAAIVQQAAANPLFVFVKEDENFLPDVPFAPLSRRVRLAMEAVRRASARRGDRGLIYAPHVTSCPSRLADHVLRAMEHGANGVMFSQYYIGGAVRMIRDLTAAMPHPPVIYGHNGGIDTRTRHIWREVLDLLARLDGVDFRQTAPLCAGMSLLRPTGLEWRQCERVLSGPLEGHAPVMMARAGGLDQGNIIPNLLDVGRGASAANYLFLAGSAINGIKDRDGRYDPALGAEAMQQALELFRQNVFTEAGAQHVRELKAYADGHQLQALSTALAQRYGL